MAACPKCGYKPIPYFDEKAYNERICAEEILEEYLDKKSSCSDDIDQNSKDGSEEKKQCRCTCKPGKICAHCRIRKLCEDIFQPEPKQGEQCNKCERQSSELYNICQSGAGVGDDCRPYLARVFSELRDLYDIKETKKKKFEKNEKCEKQFSERAKRNIKSSRVRSGRSDGDKSARSNFNVTATSTTATAEQADDNKIEAQQSIEEVNRALRKRLRREARKKHQEVERIRKHFLQKNFKKSEKPCKSKK